MITNINFFEVFSPAMKAKLDMRYRRRLQVDHQPGAESWKGITYNEKQTALPFTTRTRAYGTYHGRNQKPDSFSW
ncbi:MAG: hypothetical protein A2Y92_03745 [Chloroflexi bacterium RBG_13_57_8]|nr:MAG: hypothetical protein A2Y92_03745 [Chloroflexi bacterium RBG_13_57_8]